MIKEKTNILYKLNVKYGLADSISDEYKQKVKIAKKRSYKKMID
jgi:hypothetical protein